jgi:hypothetical protein
MLTSSRFACPLNMLLLRCKPHVVVVLDYMLSLLVPAAKKEPVATALQRPLYPPTPGPAAAPSALSGPSPDDRVKAAQSQQGASSTAGGAAAVQPPTSSTSTAAGASGKGPQGSSSAKGPPPGREWFVLLINCGVPTAVLGGVSKTHQTPEAMCSWYAGAGASGCAACTGSQLQTLTKLEVPPCKPVPRCAATCRLHPPAPQ